jgi:hypothetical protein
MREDGCYLEGVWFSPSLVVRRVVIICKGKLPRLITNTLFLIFKKV